MIRRHAHVDTRFANASAILYHMRSVLLKFAVKHPSLLYLEIYLENSKCLYTSSLSGLTVPGPGL